MVNHQFVTDIHKPIEADIKVFIGLVVAMNRSFLVPNTVKFLASTTEEGKAVDVTVRGGGKLYIEGVHSCY